jgi:hypothetical protein
MESVACCCDVTGMQKGWPNKKDKQVFEIDIYRFLRLLLAVLARVNNCL